MLSLIFFDNGCSQTKINQDAISFEYTAQSRGSHINIIINKKTISTTRKRGGKPNSKICSETNWNALMKVTKPVDIEKLSSLKAPSKKFQFDGAAIARLKISYQDSIFETPPFDHGNPPKEIATLVKEILSLSENIE